MMLFRTTVDRTLVLLMFWRVPESRIWSCGRLGFDNVDIALASTAMLNNLVDCMDGVN